MLVGQPFHSSCLGHVGGFGPLEITGMPAHSSVPFYFPKFRAERSKNQAKSSSPITQRVPWGTEHEEHHQPQTGHPHSTMGFPPSAAAVEFCPLSLGHQPCLSIGGYYHSGAFTLELKRLSREDAFPIIRVNFCFQKCYQYVGAGCRRRGRMMPPPLLLVLSLAGGLTCLCPRLNSCIDYTGIMCPYSFPWTCDD